MSFVKLTVFLLLCSFAYAQKSTCNVNAIGKAQQDFNQKLGFPSYLNWTTPYSLGIAIQNVFINGGSGVPPTNGLVAVCNAYNTFLSSLSAANVDFNDCLNPRFIIKNDVTPTIGYAYAGLMRMVEYQCGAGLFPAIGSWSCLQNTYTQRNVTLLGILSNIHLDAESNYTAACTYTKTAMINWQQQFLQTCGNNTDVTYYACQTIRAYTSAAYGECDDRCQIFDSGRSAVYAINAEIDKLEKYNEAARNVPSSNQILLEELKAKYMRYQ